MAPPQGFSWINKPLLAALARPEAVEDLAWLRRQGIEVLVSLIVPIVRLAFAVLKVAFPCRVLAPANTIPREAGTLLLLRLSVLPAPAVSDPIVTVPPKPLASSLRQGRPCRKGRASRPRSANKY